MMGATISDVKVLISAENVALGVQKISDEINTFYGNDEVLYLICTLKGATIFFTDLAKKLKMPLQMDFLRVSSYGDDVKSSNNVQLAYCELSDLTGKNVLIVDDIMDTGNSASFLLNLIRTKYAPKSCKFVTFLNKQAARKVNLQPDFYAYEVEDKFLVGYGLDYKGFFRNLPFVGFIDK